MKQQNIKFLYALLVLLISLLSVNASAHDIEVKNADGVTIYYTYINNNTKLAVSYRGSSYDSGEYSGNVVIPESVTYNGNTYSVTSIGWAAFYKCSGLTSITIPSSVTSIGTEAFAGCSGLTSVTIPNSVTSIGKNAFYGCSGLTSVTIPNSVTSIGNEAFSDCSGLTSVTIPNSVTSIGDRAFERTAWYNNQPDGLVYAGKVAYKYKGTMPSNTSIVIEEGTLEIAGNAFYNCSGLTSVTIPNSVTTIGSSAFSGCSWLTSVTIPNSVTTIGSSAFESTAWYNNQPDGLVYAGKVAYKYKGTMPSNTSIVIEEGTLGIAVGAFSGCSGLTSVTIPNSVTSIEDGVFSGCSGLTSITIPNSVTSIGSNVFRNCSGLTSVTIPNSVTTIGSFAFFGCSGLTSITIPNSVTIIGGYAFYGCSGLTSITIPNSVTSIGGGTFYGCSGLTSITIPNSVTSIGEVTFSGCSGLTSITIPNSVTSIGDRAFKECSALTSVNISDIAAWCNIVFANNAANPLSYAKSLYLNGEALTNVIIPNSATAIGLRAFYGCSSMTSITIPNSVKSIEVEAFSGCDNLTSVISEITEPFNCGTDAFPTNACRNGTLYVPAGTKDLYIRFDGWRNFLHIEEGGETAKYKLSFVVNNKELSTKNVEVGATIAPPTTDGEGNTVTWYTYPATMPAHDLVVYGMVVKPEPAPAPAKYTLTYMLDGQQYKQVTIEAGAAVAKETAPSKEGYTFSGWQNEPATMPAQNTTVTGRFTINSYRLSFIAENKELSSKNVTYGSQITAPSTDGEGNTITWYTYPTTMPAHDLVVYGMVVRQPEPEVLVWLTVKDGQGTTKMKVRKGTEQVLTITPEEGWKVVSVTWNGTDVTAQTKDGNSYTTPAITSDATLIVVYEQDTPSDVASARAGQATVKVVDDGVVITHAEPQSRCVVYTSNGQQVVSTVIEGDNQKIRLQKGQVYILTINGRTLKFAL